MTDNLQPPLPSLRCFSLRKFTERGTHAIEIKTVVREIERDDGVFDDTALNRDVLHLKKGGFKTSVGHRFEEGRVGYRDGNRGDRVNNRVRVGPSTGN